MTDHLDEMRRLEEATAAAYEETEMRLAEATTELHIVEAQVASLESDASRLACDSESLDKIHDDLRHVRARREELQARGEEAHRAMVHAHERRFAFVQSAVVVARSGQIKARDALVGGNVLSPASPPRHAVALRVTRPRLDEIVSAWFTIAELFLPRRLRQEEIGDAMETLARFREEGRRPWHFVLFGVSTTFWLAWHVFVYVKDGVLSFGKTSAK